MVPLLVLYGSQTGNAQAIAERVHREVSATGIATTLCAANEWKKLPADSALFEEQQLLLVVCSTTGQGDA